MTPAECHELLDWIEAMIEQIPGGIDYDAEWTEDAPGDTAAHIGGLIWQRIQVERKAAKQ